MSEVTNESYVPKHTNDDPEHDAGYPPYVITLEQMRRWDTCEELAEAMPTSTRESVEARCGARSGSSITLISRRGRVGAHHLTAAYEQMRDHALASHRL